MPGESSSGGVTLPVSVVETLERDGRRVLSLRVFCARRGHSVAPEVCAACSFASAVSAESVICGWPGAAPHVDPEAPLYIGAGASALRTPVGAVRAAHVLAIRSGAPGAEVRAALDEERYVVVLGADDHVERVVTDSPGSERVAGEPQGARPEATVTESEPLRGAIDRMIHGGRRFLPVVDDEGRLVGAVTDLDLLRWARRQRG